MKLIEHHYGKAKIRVLKVFRAGKTHSIKELDVQVMLQGDFEASYTKSDNRLVIATDSVKNIVNVLAKQKLGTETEAFGLVLGEYFLKTYPHVGRVEVHSTEHCWTRISASGKPHPHSFQAKSATKPFANIVCTRTGSVIESGIEEVFVLKSTASGFASFLRDEFTTLPETSDRVCATKLNATWTYVKEQKSYSKTNVKILEALLGVFANNFSPSLQTTLFQMGEAALKIAPEISKIRLAMPNKHCLLINLKPFGLENENELFTPTDEPHGQIEGVISR